MRVEVNYIVPAHTVRNVPSFKFSLLVLTLQQFSSLPKTTHKIKQMQTEYNKTESYIKAVGTESGVKAIKELRGRN